ncbi:isochorismatase family protein family [Aspergillus saccharolyticus JOP 1030-1]|uniref:Isochorismatase family protein family n=1 Tax=Aspergillus saccharolyticus JOP 1030-1 TaxID=1450539 RepID=A0A318ZPT6_9EURO|nr:isochorismatase family protein family [Aspergillus saccharolyticus JOP 1030-1]PYH48554.1 isochorismatase family protein family [Aspergillus saccharolyticus JOP 1030-1]
MSFIPQFGNLPPIQTRKALLLLDLQNDFVRSTGSLHVPNTADFLESIPPLASTFRRNGDVVWVRSVYQSPQPLISPSDGQDLVVLGRQDLTARTKRTPEDETVGGCAKGDGTVDEEAFLSAKTPQCCLPQTPGAQFPAPVFAAIDSESDTLIEKSGYSALSDPNLILSFRTRFITEIYLCGSLSNTSVYATALDAVRHGFSVTLVEDCLGYRSFPRHEEAMRRMADIFGASGITTQELLEELDWEETDAIARSSNTRPLRTGVPTEIEGGMDGLDFGSKSRSAIEEGSPESLAGSGRRRRIEDLMAEFSDHDNQSLQELASLARARAQTAASETQSANAGLQKVRARVRRTKKMDAKGESAARTDPRRSEKSRKREVYRPGDKIGEGDSRIIYDLELPEEAFEKIRDEVAWQKMYHLSGQVPRLVAVQGHALDDGSIPIYRHPADESPPLQRFTPTVDEVRTVVERILGHPLNHALIQLYRDGQDRISEHSDKTLDIVRGSFICNVSLGAQRVMVLRTKGKEAEGTDTGRLTQRIPMPHESLFILGEKTNMRWLHGIRPDKRAVHEKSLEERAYGGQRISLTFRHIGTFLSPAGDAIWGQGAVSKTLDNAHAVIHGQPEETERLIRAFGQENHATEFDWDGVYGAGFDVVNFVTATTAKLVLGPDPVANLRVRLCLSENGLRYDAVNATDTTSDLPVYIDGSEARVAGDSAILTHFSAHASELVRPEVEALRGGCLLGEVDQLLSSWRNQGQPSGDVCLDRWEALFQEQPFASGASFGIDDCALWPVLWDIQSTHPLLSTSYPNLVQYYARVEKRGIVKATLEEMA